jgi:hypothetical protein
MTNVQRSAPLSPNRDFWSGRSAISQMNLDRISHSAVSRFKKNSGIVIDFRRSELPGPSASLAALTASGGGERSRTSVLNASTNDQTGNLTWQFGFVRLCRRKFRQIYLNIIETLPKNIAALAWIRSSGSTLLLENLFRNNSRRQAQHSILAARERPPQVEILSLTESALSTVIDNIPEALRP